MGFGSVRRMVAGSVSAPFRDTKVPMKLQITGRFHQIAKFVYEVGKQDRIIGVLPFFHSFGFTVTIWFPVVTGCGVAYHPNPTDAKSIGALVSKYKGTFLLSTPTFCANYTRKCSKEDKKSTRVSSFRHRKHLRALARDVRAALAVARRQNESKQETRVCEPNFSQFAG